MLIPKLKKFRQNFIINQLLIKPLAKDMDAAKIILAEGEEVDAVRVFIHEAQALFGQFVKSVGVQATEEDAVLNTGESVFFAYLGNFVPGFVFNDVVHDPDQDGTHLKFLYIKPVGPGHA